jgi:TRAP-type C4-dicarboxylate transport system substrate-binding protein
MSAKALIGLLAVAIVSGDAAAATLKFGSFEPAQGSPARNNYIPWFRAVEKDSNGALTFQEFWGGQLSRAPDKQFELVMNGIQDVTVTLPSYTQALFPEFSMFELPFTFKEAVEGATAQWRMYEQKLLSGLDKVKVVAIYNNGNSTLHLNKKIAKLEDVKGMKIRTAGPEEADLIVALGAAPVAMAISQVAESLNRGVIDGTLNGFAANTTFKITPLLKSHFEAPFGVRTFFFSIRKDAYDALPEAARKAIDKHSGLETSKAFANTFEREGAVARDEANKDPARNVIVATAQQQEALRKLFQPQHDRWIQGHADGKRKYDALQKILAEMRGGRN